MNPAVMLPWSPPPPSRCAVGTPAAPASVSMLLSVIPRTPQLLPYSQVVTFPSPESDRLSIQISSRRRRS
uniref:Uncharacterized protein n=1 Tax=Arundo donax TaxID=35708 RepID=A0A0A9G0Z9_ARUDO